MALGPRLLLELFLELLALGGPFAELLELLQVAVALGVVAGFLLGLELGQNGLVEGGPIQAYGSG